MIKYYVVSDSIPEGFYLTISCKNPSEAAIKAAKIIINKYQILYEPSDFYVDQRGYRTNRMTATNVFSTTEILKKIIV
jgi:hypothetical protein